MVSAAITTLCDMVEHCRIRLDDISPVAAVPVSNLELIQAAAEIADQTDLLWTDEELRHYANEAIKEVAIRTLCLRKGHERVTNLNLFNVDAGENTIVIDPRVLLIKRVWWKYDATGESVVLIPESETFLDDQESPNSAGSWRTNETSEPCKFVLHRDDRRLQLVGVPTVDGQILLEVIRLPLEAIETGVPEIPQNYLADCINWMCHLAYLKNDADTVDPEKSAKHEDLFEKRVGPRRTDLMLQLAYNQGGRRRGRLYWF